MTTTDAGDDDRTSFDCLSPEAMVRVNQWCDKFERSWREGEPSLKEFYASIDAVDSTSVSSVLVAELIAIDVRHRQMRRLECSTEHYLLQFPHFDRRELEQVINVASRSECRDDNGPLFPNQQLGDYVIIDRIGSGGMGSVYRGEHQLMGRHVAIKVLSGRSANDQTSKRRFLREVRSFAKLSHPNIIAAFDARLEGELLYLVTEWVQGEDLAKKVASCGPLPINESLDYVRQAALGLHYAHTQGIVHRDVKPSNLLLDPCGTVKVLDLGLSRWILDGEENSAESLTKSMNLLGTASYMAPEQARSPLSSSPKSDIYSLGCTLYFLLTGTPPYTCANAVDVLVSHARDPIPDVRGLRAHVDLGTAELLQSMLAKDPSHRPPTMADVAQQLEGLIGRAAKPSVSQPLGMLECPPRSVKSRQSGAKLMIGGSVLAVILFLVALLNQSTTARLFSSLGANGARDFDPNAGVTMNGQSSYGKIVDFDLPLPDSALIEASITPHRTAGPANLIIWTGDRILGLFLSHDGRWGVSLADGVNSYIEVSSVKATPGQQQVIGARYNGRAIELFINGRLMQTSRADYAMIANETTVYFGGLPRGALPLDQGTRFLAGNLHRIRISTGVLPSPASRTADMVEIPQSTVALIQFSETNENDTVDARPRDWQVQLVDMPSAMNAP